VGGLQMGLVQATPDRISDGGHTWPGSSPNAGLGYTTHAIDANIVIWNFFRQFTT
jgi:poly(3-hydroxybutyrate) depolymerase